MRYLKQATSVDVGIGPFLDDGDGKTAETTLTITQSDVRLKKNAGAWAQKAAAQTLTHEENGWYELTLDGTDTDTIGHLLVAIHESGALPVWQEYHVLAANVYDSLFGAATDKLDVNVEEWNTTAVPAEHTAGYPIVTIKDGAGTGEINTNGGKVVGVELVDSLTALAAGAITAAAIATDAIDADALAADAVTELQAGLSTLTAAGIRTAVGLASANLDTQLADLPTNAELATALAAADDAILAAIAALNNLSSAQAQTAATSALTAFTAATAAQVAAVTSTLSALLATLSGYVDTEVAAIKAKTDSLTFTVAGVVDANVQRINDVTITGDGSATPFGV